MDDALRAMGRFVRERRAALKLTQGDVGDAIGRDQTYVSDIERGAMASLPPVDILRPMAAVLRCTTLDVLVAAGYVDPADDQSRDDRLAESAAFYEALRVVNAAEHELARAGQVIEALIDTRYGSVTRQERA